MTSDHLEKFESAYQDFAMTAGSSLADHKLLFRQFADLLNLSLSVMRVRIMTQEADFTSIRSDAILAKAAERGLVGDVTGWKEMTDAWETLPKLRGPITLGDVVTLLSTKYKSDLDTLHAQMTAKEGFAL